jgi:hypothetical protein
MNHERMTDTWDGWISSLERDHSLLKPNRLRQRIEVLDRLEAHPAWAGSDASSGLSAEIRTRISRLCADLEAVNQRVYASIREAIQRGNGAQSLLEWAPAVGPGNDARHPVDNDGYDGLDALLSGVLQIEEPSPVAQLAAEMVFYQPTPARHIFELIARTGLSEHDVLVDLGSGLGHVPLLAAICTRAHCVGIEWQAAYVDCARRCAKALNLANVAFLRQDARAADLSTGTVFYLYTPFTGAMLAEVLAMLRREAAAREIRIGTLGSCTAYFVQELWLESIGTPKAGGLTVFRSVGPAG